jgi:hypothetical protein
MDDNFYITLPSNVKSVSSEPNKIGHYHTTLPKPLQFSPSTKWEVALVEICYPFSWDNVHTDLRVINYKRPLPSSDLRVELGTSQKKIPQAYYSNLQDLIEAINDVKPRWFKGTFQLRDDIVELALADSQSITLHPQLSAILGFKTNHWVQGEHPLLLPPPKGWSTSSEVENLDIIKASYKGDIRVNMYNMFVYSNIVKETLVGDSFVPLLRTVPLDNEIGNYVHKSFETPHYIPLNTQFIPSIEIKLTDDTGECVRFDRGKVIVKLHFRKHRSYMYQ